MDWQLFLVNLYSTIQEIHDTELVFYTQRMSANTDKLQINFTDCEALTMYIFGIIKKHHEITEIYNYIKEHWLSWFPKLPSYVSFVNRLNWLSPALPILLNRISYGLTLPDWLIQSLASRRAVLEASVDSFPIIMAQRGRADSAKVACEIANKGYCSTKNLWYHGLKMHSLNILIPQSIPQPIQVVMSAASESDLTVFKDQIAPTLYNMRVFADKIYNDDELELNLSLHQNVELLPIEKKQKGQAELHSDDKIYNTLKSKCRQPIESFFSWIDRKTGIQNASRVRSTKGLIVHVWGRLIAAFILLACNP